MKRRFSTILTVTVAAVLVSSLAYAAKKKLQAKSKSLTPDVSEVDLAANLLDANGNKHKLPKTGDTNKRGDEELKDLTMVKELKK
ncbi:MAG TPA: hypothetical protein VN642_17545 [Dongiaceae bacterium]|nr:hypothetical protein [Dongiaceae bacterium]